MDTVTYDVMLSLIPVRGFAIASEIQKIQNKIEELRGRISLESRNASCEVLPAGRGGWQVWLVLFQQLR